MFPDDNHDSYRYQTNPGSDQSSPQIDGSCLINESSSSSSSSEGESPKEKDHSDAILKFISQMLMEEEDLVNKPCMLHDCLALQATEKSLYDALNDSSPSHLDSNLSPSINLGDSLLLPLDQSMGLLDPHPLEIVSGSVWDFDSFSARLPNTSRENKKKHRHREDGDSTEEGRSNKQLANSVGELETFEMYDRVLLCSNSELARVEVEEKARRPEKTNDHHSKGPTRGRPRGGKKQPGVIKEVVDLRSLLMQCAQAVASFDSRTVGDLLVRIRQHSSPQGDGMERLAHYFANAIDARMAGTGMSSYATISIDRISAAEILKAYKTYITACPFKKMSNVLANKTIMKLANKADTLHIVDFGILYGYQWPCLIQSLSERPGGPPKLRITGIDFPQPGFRPKERIEATGQRLRNYCKRFGVPFEYTAIAQKWETIKPEDLRIKKGELLVVNSIYRLHNVLDETVTVTSPRDVVLSLIRQINPEMFIQGEINGTYNTPFFITRFREALFHFSSMFDMFEATVGSRQDQNRLRFEEQVFAKDAMNIIACEGTERIDRPETYKQWQVRNVRAGFRQLPLDQELVKFVRNKVKKEYHKDFSVDEDGKWMLQGWKGRVIYAISCWKPATSD